MVQGETVTEAARQAGVSRETVYKWQKEYLLPPGDADENLTPAELSPVPAKERILTAVLEFLEAEAKMSIALTNRIRTLAENNLPVSDADVRLVEVLTARAARTLDVIRGA